MPSHGTLLGSLAFLGVTLSVSIRVSVILKEEPETKAYLRDLIGDWEPESMSETGSEAVMERAKPRMHFVITWATSWWSDVWDCLRSHLTDISERSLGKKALIHQFPSLSRQVCPSTNWPKVNSPALLGSPPPGGEVLAGQQTVL